MIGHMIAALRSHRTPAPIPAADTDPTIDMEAFDLELQLETWERNANNQVQIKLIDAEKAAKAFTYRVNVCDHGRGPSINGLMVDHVIRAEYKRTWPDIFNSPYRFVSARKRRESLNEEPKISDGGDEVVLHLVSGERISAGMLPLFCGDLAVEAFTRALLSGRDATHPETPLLEAA